MQRILVLRGGALGDFIVTLPALALLRDRWPTATIDLVGHATAAVLGTQAGLLTHAESQHDRRWSALYDHAPLPAALASRLASYDLVVNYWPDPDGALARHFPIHPAQVFLATSAHPPTQPAAPAAAHYCAPLAALGLNPTDFSYRLPQGSSLSTLNPQLSTSPRIALHPGSGSSTKNWPLAHWTTLADTLAQQTRAEICIISGEAEPAAILHLPGQHWHNLPLTELATRLASCRLYLGHDTGISHLAAAVGTPSLLLFGPTNPEIWAPPHPHVRVLHRGPDLSALTFAEVQQTATTLLAKW